MWTCKKCGEIVEDQFDSCWKCSAPTGQEPSGGTTPGPRKLRMAYKYYRGTLASWDELFSQAAAFASDVGPEHLLGISHSCDECDGVVTVWYWTSAEPPGND
jgi:hypothetical protein